MERLQFKGRLAISGPREKGSENLSQYIVGGALVGLKDMPVTKSDGWEMIECDVIIIPTKIHRKVHESFKGAKLDMVAQIVHDGRKWSQREYPEKDIYDELLGQ